MTSKGTGGGREIISSQFKFNPPENNIKKAGRATPKAAGLGSFRVPNATIETSSGIRPSFLSGYSDNEENPTET